jgi:hypothetical protein
MSWHWHNVVGERNCKNCDHAEVEVKESGLKDPFIFYYCYRETHDHFKISEPNNRCEHWKPQTKENN